MTIHDAIGRTITVYKDGEALQVEVTDIQHSMQKPVAVINGVYPIDFISLFAQLHGEERPSDEELVEAANDFELVKVPEPGMNRKARRTRKAQIRKYLKSER